MQRIVEAHFSQHKVDTIIEKNETSVKLTLTAKKLRGRLKTLLRGLRVMDNVTGPVQWSDLSYSYIWDAGYVHNCLSVSRTDFQDLEKLVFS
jgi:hypothetical protein